MESTATSNQSNMPLPQASVEHIALDINGNPHISGSGIQVKPKAVKPKAKGAKRAGQPRKSAAKSKPASQASAQAKPSASPKQVASGNRPTKALAGEKVAKAASRLSEGRVRDMGDWREETLARMRALILEADPEMIEE